MKQNDFYEVNGCTDFIPVTIVGISHDGVIVTPANDKRNCQLEVEEVYRLPKPPELEKPVVQKFVADLYEEIKDDFENKVYDICVRFDRDNCELSSEVWGWFDCGGNEPIQTLVKMKLYGYEIEKEKLYTVEIPNPNLNTHTILQKVGKGLVLIMVTNARWRGWAESKLTESEIKQDFDFLWQFAKPVEE